MTITGREYDKTKDANSEHRASTRPRCEVSRMGATGGTECVTSDSNCHREDSFASETDSDGGTVRRPEPSRPPVTSLVESLSEQSGMSIIESLASLELSGDLRRIVLGESLKARKKEVRKKVAGKAEKFLTIHPVVTPDFFDELCETLGIQGNALDVILDACEASFRLRGEPREWFGVKRYVVSFVTNKVEASKRTENPNDDVRRKRAEEKSLALGAMLRISAMKHARGGA